MKKITILILLLCIFSVFAASAFAQSSNLIAAYSFNEGSGTTLGDSSGNGLNGAVSGATWTAGKYGNGLNFDGTNDWVTVNDAASLDLTSSMTLEAWVYPTAINSDWRTVMLKEMSGGLAYSLYATDGANRPPAVYARIGYDRSAVGTSVLPLNAWTHLTGTYSSGALRLYVNGNLVRTTSVSGSMATSSNPLRIGGNSVWGEWFKGKIDEIRIYNRVLSQAEIQSDMNTPIGGQQALPIISSFNATPSSIIAGENSTLAWSTINATNVSINQGIGAVAASGSINVAPAATTTYTLTATNSGGSVNQNTIVFVSQPPDTTSPTANLTSPASGSTVSGTINVVATATDNVGVAGVQFLLDGANLGSEDTTSPYSVSWNTASSSNGQHTLQARARDAAGNLGFSSLINVTVDNFVDITPPTRSNGQPSGILPAGTTLTTISLNTDETATCRYSTTQNTIYSSMINTFTTTGSTSHSTTVSGLANGNTYNYYVRCQDTAGNANTNDFNITFSVASSSGTPLSINGAQQFQIIDGFGVSANSLSWNNGELEPALDMLVDQLGANIWRVIIDNADWESVNDDPNPNNFNWTYYNSVYSSAKFEELWSTISYLNQKLITDGIVINFMGPVPNWMGGSSINTASESEWVEMIASLVYYARNNRSLQFSMLAPMNEPDWDGIEGPQVDQFQYTRIMRNLSDRLDALGLNDLRLVGPDTASISMGVNSYMPQMMTDSILMSKIDHFGFHNYAGDSGGADSAIKNSAYPNKNFWITEVSNIWDVFTHLSQGPAATLVWDAYDSVYNHAILAGRGNSPPNDAGNGPALLSYDTGSGNYTPRKAFYQHAQLYKFVPRNSMRIAATESSGNLLAYAFYHNATGRITIVGETGASPMTLSVTLANLPTISQMNFYQTDGYGKNMQYEGSILVVSNALSVTMDAGSYFTLTGTGSIIPDTTSPTANLTSPASGSTVSGTINVVATATDNVGVAGVQFLLDGANLGSEDATSPYSASWNTASSSNGQHTLQARARDAAGNLGFSSLINVTVDNFVDITSPNVTVTSPLNNSNINGTITVSAAAADNLGVIGVQFKLDGANLGPEDASSPYLVNWDTTTAANGQHILSATARDAVGNVNSHSVVVNVANAPPPQPSDLVAAYGFNEGNGTNAADSSGNGLTGAISGATWTTGKYGNALQFDGTNDWVTINDNILLDLTNGMTIEAWVKPSSLSGWTTVALKERSGGLAYAIYASDGSSRPPAVYANIGGFDSSAIDTQLLALNTWTHIAGTYDGSVLRFYRNGVLVASNSNPGTITTSTGALRIGGNSVWGEYLNGAIDEVRIYKIALTQAEIQNGMSIPIS